MSKATATEYLVWTLKQGVWVEEESLAAIGRKHACQLMRAKGFKKEGGNWKIRVAPE